MTTIAWDGHSLAADSLATWGSNRDGTVTKIARKGPFLAGVSGALPPCQRFLDWFASGMQGDPPQFPSGDLHALGVIILPSDLVLSWTQHGWERTRNSRVSIGSGAEFAQGAMSAGASARQAVEIACLHDTKSGPPIVSLTR